MNVQTVETALELHKNLTKEDFEKFFDSFPNDFEIFENFSHKETLLALPAYRFSIPAQDAKKFFGIDFRIKFVWKFKRDEKSEIYLTIKHELFNQLREFDTKSPRILIAFLSLANRKALRDGCTDITGLLERHNERLLRK